MTNHPSIQLPQFDKDELKQLVELMAATGLAEIEIGEGANRLKLKRDTHTTQVIAAAPSSSPAMPAPEPAVNLSAPANVLKSPMVGTFYHAASPDAEPFVKPGDQVTKGQTIGIIEAMKTMNPIEADCDGVVANILIDNAKPVEFGEPLISWQ